MHRMRTGGIRQILFEKVLFWARATREGRRDESIVNNSGSKLKIRLTGPLGNRMARPSGLFLGPGDKFLKKYDENRFVQDSLTWKRIPRVHVRARGQLDTVEVRMICLL
jgi:hypothetical protein